MAKDPAEPIECAAIFVVRDIAASLAYLRAALGFETRFTWGEPIIYAGVCRGAVTIHLQAASQTAGSADAIQRELVRRGARILKPPANYPYRMRDFDVLDPDGSRLVFGSSEP